MRRDKERGKGGCQEWLTNLGLAQLWRGDGGSTLCVENGRGEAGLVRANSKCTIGHGDFEMLVIHPIEMSDKQ